MNGAQALFKALTDAGLDTCFANPGTSSFTKSERPKACAPFCACRRIP
jgi:thiamine pyrophosphate-dependent acetolactate synthase large subunit-like protein